MKYPKGTICTKQQNINYANRGMCLENDINETNLYYKENEVALIYKKPTPIKITKVDYPSRSKAVIKEAFFATPSTTDYNGIYQGKYIDFEVKETKNKTSFPLSNIHLHQLNHLKKVHQYGGITFIIVRFVLLNKTYILLGEELINFINEVDRNIPLSVFEKKGFLLTEKYHPRLDYLKVINEIYFSGGCNEGQNK